MYPYNEEQIAIIKTAKTVDELVKLFADYEIDADREYIQKVYNRYCGSNELSDEELENAAGGTCYSKGTTAPNGVTREYVITTFHNSCPGATWYLNDEFGYYQKGTCSWCKHHFGNVPMYCGARWVNHEALAPGFDGNNMECCDNMEPFVDGQRNW